MISDKLLPSAEAIFASLAEVEAAGNIPEPKGWKVLIAMPSFATTTKGGILLAEEYVEREESASPVALVVKLGPAAYKDERKFPGGPNCKVGDFIVVRPYSGTRIIIHGKEFRLINDDTVEAVVPDPSVIGRV